jgi:hypothetical protein
MHDTIARSELLLSPRVLIPFDDARRHSRTRLHLTLAEAELGPHRTVVSTNLGGVAWRHFSEPGRDWRRGQAMKRLTNSHKLISTSGVVSRKTRRPLFAVSALAADLIQSRRSEYNRPTASPR